MNKINVFALCLLGISLTGCNQPGDSLISSEELNESIKPSEIISVYEEELPDKRAVLEDYKDGMKRSTFSNPVNIVDTAGNPWNYSFADPSIFRDGDGKFYAYTTGRSWMTSDDGCNWVIQDSAVIENPQWPKDDGYSGYSLWAPDISKIGDTYYYVYSLSGWGNPVGIGYATASKITGPYTDRGKLFYGREIAIDNCIDPQIFIDDDEKIYITCGSFQGLYTIELDCDKTTSTLSVTNGIEWAKQNKHLIAGHTGSWDGSTYEGSYIIKKDGFYYYFGSSGTCCEGENSSYRVVVGKSSSIFGPYVGSNSPLPMTYSQKYTYGNVVVQKPLKGGENYAGPGHNSVFMDDNGDYWIYYHCYTRDDEWSNRRLFMDKLLWDEDGYPYVYNKRPSFKTLKYGPAIYID